MRKPHCRMLLLDPPTYPACRHALTCSTARAPPITLTLQVAAETQLDVLQRHMAAAAQAHQRDVAALRALVQQLDPDGRVAGRLRGLMAQQGQGQRQ